MCRTRDPGSASVEHDRHDLCLPLFLSKVRIFHTESRAHTGGTAVLRWMPKSQVEWDAENIVIQGVADVPVVLLLEQPVHFGYWHVTWEVLLSRCTMTSVVAGLEHEWGHMLNYCLPVLHLLVPPLHSGLASPCWLKYFTILETLSLLTPVEYRKGINTVVCVFFWNLKIIN